MAVPALPRRRLLIPALRTAVHVQTLLRVVRKRRHHDWLLHGYSFRRRHRTLHSIHRHRRRRWRLHHIRRVRRVCRGRCRRGARTILHRRRLRIWIGAARIHIISWISDAWRSWSNTRSVHHAHRCGGRCPAVSLISRDLVRDTVLRTKGGCDWRAAMQAAVPAHEKGW